MSDILSHKGNANQNITEIPSHPSQNGSHQKNKQQMLAREWGERSPYTLLVGM
jgi:hypothetical protein